MARSAIPRQIRIYQDQNQRRPYLDWLLGLRDKKTKARILRHVARMQQGNLGDHKPVGDSVMELRLHFGAGYRVYFAQDGDTIVVLLCAGAKSSQRKDIERAKAFWNDYKARIR